MALNYKYNRQNFITLISDNKQLKYFYEEKKLFYKQKHKVHTIENDLSCRCHVCKGSGWITNNNISNGFNFGYERCYLCSGMGFY